MKKNGILNAPLSKVVALMGHTDRLVICDCGLPIPKNAEIIDLALTKNIPRFLDVLKIVLEELHVEDAIVAKEITSLNSELFKQISSLLKDVKIKKVPHENFKKLTRENGTITFVRTGEATPYANIILFSGVAFK